MWKYFLLPRMGTKEFIFQEKKKFILTYGLGLSFQFLQPSYPLCEKTADSLHESNLSLEAGGLCSLHRLQILASPLCASASAGLYCLLRNILRSQQPRQQPGCQIFTQ